MLVTCQFHANRLLYRCTWVEQIACNLLQIMKTEMFMIAIALELLPITTILAILHVDRTIIYIEVSNSNRLIVNVLTQIGTYDKLPNRELIYEFHISRHMFIAISHLEIALYRLRFNQTESES